jgi:hypothetical protein
VAFRENVAALRALGVKFEAKSGGQVLVIRRPGRVVDFWPSTGKWRVRSFGASSIRHMNLASKRVGQGLDGLKLELEII